MTEYSTPDEARAAFLWDRPEKRDGIVLAFRRPGAAISSIKVQLHNLEPGARYEVAFVDHGLTLIKAGAELAAGLSVKIPEAPGSLLVKYRRLPD